MFSVRGKRRKHDALDATEREQRKRGRPLKHPLAPQGSRRAFNAQLQRFQQDDLLRSSTDHETMSPLELLPNELLHQIFFYSFETNLARASVRLASVLSDESIYRALILFAFFDDDEINKVETRLFLPATYRPLSVEEKIRLQSGILKCRWCTVGRIRSCLPDLCKLSMLQEAADERQREIDLRQRFGSLLCIHVSDHNSWRAELPDIQDIDRLEDHFAARARSKPQNECLDTAMPQPYNLALETWMFDADSETGEKVKKVACWTRSIFAARTIPDALLCSEIWSRDRLDLLQLLQQGSYYVYDTKSLQFSFQAIIQGITSAIKTRYREALLTLLDINCAFVLNHEHSLKSHLLPIQLFHLAARQEDASSDLLHALLRASQETVPHDDTTLTAWAIRRDKEERTASWLLDRMSDTSVMKRTGNGSTYRSSSAFDFQEVDSSFAKDLGYFYA